MGAFSKVVLILVCCAGCAVPDLAEEEGTSSQAATVSACADYPKNPACNAESFVSRAWTLANEDPKANLLDPIANAKNCIKGLAEAGALVVASDGLAVPAILSPSSVASGIQTFYACKAFAEYLDRTGLPSNISCLVSPVLYSPTVMACKCTEKCQGGVYNTGGRTGEALSTRTSFRYGFLDRAGTANCYCTNEAKEAKCQLRCAKWASTSSTDCKCAAL